jgi:hypothetical protein
MDDNDGANVFQWQGKHVRVSARSVFRYLGLTASIDVYVAGTLVLATGGKLRMSGTETARFNDTTGTHFVELRWRAVPRFPTVINRYVQPLQYELRLDGELVGESTVELNYLPAAMVLTLVVGCILLLVLQYEIGAQFRAASHKLAPATTGAR